MTNEIRLGDADMRARAEARREHFRTLAREALEAEMRAAPPDIVEALAQAALYADHGRHPGIFKPAALTETKRAFESLQNEGRKTSAMVESLCSHLSGASMDLHLSLRDALEARGIDEATLNAVLESIEAAGQVLARTRQPKCVSTVEQGRNPDALNAWVARVWPGLEAAGLSMRAAARVCSAAFTGGTAKADTLYQAIRNASR